MDVTAARVSLRVTLKSKIEQREPFTAAVLVRMSGPLREALNEYHGLGKAVRNLAPHNIEVVYEDDRPVFRLTDISLVERSAGVRDDSVFIGDIWLAPEQRRCLGDARADVWRFAAVLFVCLAASGTLDLKQVERLLNKVRLGTIPGVREYRGDLTEHVERALRKALDPVPASRHASVDALLEDLADERTSPPQRKRIETRASIRPFRSHAVEAPEVVTPDEPQGVNDGVEGEPPDASAGKGPAITLPLESPGGRAPSTGAALLAKAVFVLGVAVAVMPVGMYADRLWLRAQQPAEALPVTTVVRPLAPEPPTTPPADATPPHSPSPSPRHDHARPPRRSPRGAAGRISRNSTTHSPRPR